MKIREITTTIPTVTHSEMNVLRNFATMMNNYCNDHCYCDNCPLQGGCSNSYVASLDKLMEFINDNLLDSIYINDKE